MGSNRIQDALIPLTCDTPNPTLGVKRGCLFLFLFFKLIAFKLVQSYIVKHLTCNIFRSNGLQNIYKLHIWKCSTVTIFTLFTKETKTTYTKIDQKVFQWAPSDVLALTADADCPVLWFPLLYLHGRKLVLSFTLSGNNSWTTTNKSHHTLHIYIYI